MFREMRKKTREIFNDDILNILDVAEYGVLATVDENGYPYAVPLNYVYIDNAIYLHSAPSGHKLDNISNNPKVSFSIVSETEIVEQKFTTKYKSIIAFGTASLVSGIDKEEALLNFIKKYTPTNIEKGKKYIEMAKDVTVVLKIEIEDIKGKAGK